MNALNAYHSPVGVHYNDANCTNNYIPNTQEYFHALGLYAVWLLIIGGIATLLLYGIFLEQVFFSQRGAHRVFRRHIFWIASVYPFMTMMSLASVLVPRAHNICTGVKQTYMAIGITHFADLTQLMYGSEEVMLATIEGHRVNLRVGPVCCCCCCLPSPKVSKRSIRLAMFLCNQLAFSQAFYYITILILIAAGNLVLGAVNPTSVYLWLSLLNMVSFMSGVWGLQILARLSNDYLKHYNYNNKSFSMKTLVLVTNFQTFILAILGNYDVFPCIPPYISPQCFRQTVENSLYFLEMLLLGCYTYYQYHNKEFLTPNPTEITPEDQQKYCRSVTTSTTVSSITQGDTCDNIVDQLAVISEEPRSSTSQEAYTRQIIEHGNIHVASHDGEPRSSTSPETFTRQNINHVATNATSNSGDSSRAIIEFPNGDVVHRHSSNTTQNSKTTNQEDVFHVPPSLLSSTTV